MTTLTAVQSIADGIDKAIDVLSPIIGVFVPYSSDVKLAADALIKLIDYGIAAATAYEGGGTDAALASLTASKTQLQNALSDAQQLAKDAGANYPGQPVGG